MYGYAMVTGRAFIFRKCAPTYSGLKGLCVYELHSKVSARKKKTAVKPCCSSNYVLWRDSLGSNPVPVNAVLFGNEAFADVIELRRGHTGSGWALTAVTSVLIGTEEARRHTDTRTKAYKGRGRPSDAAKCWALPRLFKKHQKLDDKHGTHPPSGPPEGTNPCRHLDFRFLTRTGRE